MYVAVPLFDEKCRKKGEGSLEGRNSKRRDPCKVFGLREESVRGLWQEFLMASKTQNYPKLVGVVASPATRKSCDSGSHNLGG